MSQDYNDWLERLAESDEFTDYIIANLPEQVMRTLLYDFADVKLEQSQRYAMERS